MLGAYKYAGIGSRPRPAQPSVDAQASQVCGEVSRDVRDVSVVLGRGVETIIRRHRARLVRADPPLGVGVDDVSVVLLISAE